MLTVRIGERRERRRRARTLSCDSLLQGRSQCSDLISESRYDDANANERDKRPNQYAKVGDSDRYARRSPQWQSEKQGDADSNRHHPQQRTPPTHDEPTPDTQAAKLG